MVFVRHAVRDNLGEYRAFPRADYAAGVQSSASERRSDVFKQLEAIFYALKQNRPYGNVGYRIVDMQLALRDCLQWTSMAASGVHASILRQSPSGWSRNTVLDAYVPHGNSQEHERMFLVYGEMVITVEWRYHGEKGVACCGS